MKIQTYLRAFGTPRICGSYSTYFGKHLLPRRGEAIDPVDNFNIRNGFTDLWPSLYVFSIIQLNPGVPSVPVQYKSIPFVQYDGLLAPDDPDPGSAVESANALLLFIAWPPATANGKFPRRRRGGLTWTLGIRGAAGGTWNRLSCRLSLPSGRESRPRPPAWRPFRAERVCTPPEEPGKLAIPGRWTAETG